MNKLLFLLLLVFADSYAQNKSINKDSLSAVQYTTLAKDHYYNNPALSKKYARQAILHARKAKQVVLEATGYNALGLCHRNLSEYGPASAYFKKAAALYKQADNRIGYGNARNNLSMTLFYLGDYEEATTLLFEVIDEAEKHDINKVLSNAYQNLGIINNSQERYQAALDNFVLAEKYYALEGDTGSKAGAANNQAFIYFKHLKQYDKAIAIYTRTIPIKEKIKDDKGVGISYNNLAEIYLIKKEYKKALENINKAIPIRLKINDQYGLTFSYMTLAGIYLQQHQLQDAEKYATQAVAIAQKIGAKKELSEALLLLSSIQQAGNDSGAAYSSLLKAEGIKDSLLNRENFAKMAELETKYQTEKKERQILAQRAEIAEGQIAIDNKNMAIWGVCALAIIAVMAGYLIYNKQKMKTIKLEKEAELKDALLFIETQSKLQDQRLRISRDLHDNIGSQLTFIISSLDNIKYSFDIANEGLRDKLFGIRNFTKDTITELRDTIWAMNKEEITLADLKTRISNFIDNAKAASKGVDFIFEIGTGTSDTDSFSSLKGINVYRIIQEAVHNSLKHANATEIKVTINKEKGCYTITIADNGMGFDTGQAGIGNGLANIRKRIADCGGALNIESAAGGTITVVTIK